MALPQEAIELDAKRLAVVQQIEELKVEARALKKAMDKAIEKANLEFKLGIVTDEDREKMKALL